MRVEDLAAVFGRILSENVGSESMVRPVVTCVRALLVAQVSVIHLLFVFSLSLSSHSRVLF